MKKIIKKILSVAAICFALGMLLIFVMYVIVKGDLSKMNIGSKYEKKEYEIEQSKVENLDINLDSVGLEIIGMDTDKIHITYYENENQKYEITDNQKTLQLRKIPSNICNIFQINFNIESHRVVIEMPKELIGQLHIDNSSGSVNLNNLLVQEGIEVKISSGSMTAKDIKTNDAMTIHSKSGSVKLYDVQVKEDASIKLSSGSLTIQNLAANNVETQISSGSTKLTDVKANGQLSFDSKNGSIHLEEIHAGQKIIISSKSGSVRGSVIGNRNDFTIYSNASSGSNNLPEYMEGGKKELRVDTSSGSIKIEFAEENE